MLTNEKKGASGMVVQKAEPTMRRKWKIK